MTNNDQTANRDEQYPFVGCGWFMTKDGFRWKEWRRYPDGTVEEVSQNDD